MPLEGPRPSIVTTSASTDVHTSATSRRTPAHCSVSLLYTRDPNSARPNPHSSSSSDGRLINRPLQHFEEGDGTHSPSSLQPLGGKPGSGESSNAEKWFEKSNNEVRDNSAPFADNDPPFFMPKSSMSETPPDAREQFDTVLDQDEQTQSLPPLARLLRHGTDGSSTDDFRTVIDDLTIENKKLKRRLKRYETPRDSHLKDEKLFEVRIHGLPPERKRELEEILRRFASGLDATGAKDFPWSGYSGLVPALGSGKVVSSQVSPHKTDSAYVSMAGSGQGSSARSRNPSEPKVTPIQSSRQKNIHNYLHHIPEGLLSRQNPATMSERAKKKLVVRRMEQIFAGKGAALGGHQQYLQQEEVSQSAGRADVSDVEAMGRRARKEGTREAHIMEGETEDPLDLCQNKEETFFDKLPAELRPTTFSVQERPGFTEQSSGRANGQRPTTPLDLDPHRAQVPADNIRYMRHLGFSPDPESPRSPGDGHGWIYLNILINMAQLHTINVTSDLVRNALGEYSNKFEVSKDGRKVRWVSRSTMSGLSGRREGYSNDRLHNDALDAQSPRKRRKLSHGIQAAPGSQPVGREFRSRQTEDNQHVYTPLFHRENTDDGDGTSSDTEEDSSSSPFLIPVAGASSGMTSSGIRANGGFADMPLKKQKYDDGSIVFYNNARFCTDLSGDRRASGNPNPPLYVPASAMPIGKHHYVADGAPEKRGPLSKASELPELMNVTDNPIPESMEVVFPPRSPLGPDSSKDQKPFEFEATGIGGVWPSDNFAIAVESRQVRVDQDQVPDMSAPVAPKLLPPKFAQILRGTELKPKTRITVHEQVITSKVQLLSPSQLPPALSFMSLEDDSTDEDESDDDESLTRISEPLLAIPPSAAPRRLEIAYASSGDDEGHDNEDEVEDDEESDGEVDLLAIAREMDPQAVRQKELEYDAIMADRLSEEIPAGSSAATAGGASGFSSASSGGEAERARKHHRTKFASLKRAFTGDHMAIQAYSPPQVAMMMLQ